MTYRGHVENGLVVLDEPVELTEGTQVRIEVLPEVLSGALHPEILRFTGILPSDIDVRAEHAEGVVDEHT